MRLRSLNVLCVLLMATAATWGQQPACPQCVNTPPVYDPSEGVSYILVNSGPTGPDCVGLPSGWNISENYAKQYFNRSLVSIDDPIQNAFIVNNVMTNPLIKIYAWIGLRASINCGGFFWSDGSPVVFTGLCGGNPCGDTGCVPGSPLYGIIDKGNACWKLTINWRQCCSATPIYGIVEIPCPDVITEQPEDRCADPGETVQFSVTMSNDSVPYQRAYSYQWRRGNTDLVDGPTGTGSTIFGAKNVNTPVGSSTLFIQNAGPSDAGRYTVVITSTCRPLFESESAILTIPCSGCYADCDTSGSLSIDDFICFQTGFALGLPESDCDGNGTLSIDDFICFQTSFALGC